MRFNTNIKTIGLLAIISMIAVLITHIGILTIYSCVAAHLFLLVAKIVADFMESRRITLFQIWNLGFIYILWAEMILKSGSDRYLNAISFLLIANAILTLGYTSYKKNIIQTSMGNMWILRKDKNKLFFALMTVLFLFWLVTHYASVINSASSGRQLGNVIGNSINVGGVFLSASSLMVSALAAYYFRWCSKRSAWWSVLYLVPVFMFQMLLGTRFRLVYMLLPWLILMGIIEVKYQKIRTLAFVMLAAIALSGVSTFMRENRGLSLEEMGNVNLTDSYQKESSDFFYWLADKMSPEGCVYMTYLAEDWFSTHEYEYGKEIGFMFYWIIPRAIWKDKPTPVDHWLIRKYENVSDKYSSASGFTGEIRADFGYWCLIIVFFFGRLLHRADNYVLKSFSNEAPYLDKIFAALIYPCVFFSVRSPLTATQSFFVEGLIYLAIRRWMGVKYKLKHS